MADKPNKSNKPINGQIPKHIEEALATRDYTTSYEHLSSKADYRHLEDKLQKLELERQTAPSSQDILENIGFAEQDLSTLDKLHHDRQNEQLANKIATYTKTRNINERTTTLSSQQRFHRSASASKEIYQPTESLEARIVSRTSQINALGTEVAGRMRAIGTDEVPQSLMPKLGQISELEEGIALDKRLLKVQNRAGLSTEKMFGHAEDVQARTSRYFGAKDIEDKVARRDIRNIGDEEKALGHMSKNVSKLQGNYDTALEEGSSKVVLFAEKLDKATSALDKQQKIVETMNRQKVSGPGGGDGGQMAINRMRAVAGVAGVAANTASAIGLDYELEQTQQRTAYAGLANRQYQNVDKFLDGDMTAFLELSKGDRFSKQYSDRMRTRSMFLKGAEATAAGVDAGISGAAATGEMAAFWNADVGGSLDKGINAAGQLGKVARMGARLGMGIEQGGVGLRATLAGRDLAGALNAIPADTMQNFYNVKSGAFQGGVGLGYQRNVMMADMTSMSNLKQFADAGLSPQQAIKAAGMAVPNIGVTEDYSDMVLRAGKAQQRGILGIGNYMSNIGQLADVGGGSSDLESIMSKAISAGMENAKNINQMVQATSAMASGSAAMGISTTGATSNMLAASIQSMRTMGVGKNIVTGAAANALNAADQAGGVMGSFADLQYRATMKDTYGKELGHYEQLGLRNLNQAAMKEILDGSDTGKKYVEQFGLGSVLGIEGGKFKTDQDRNKFEKLRRGFTKKEVIEQMGPSAALSNLDVVESVVNSRIDGGTVDDKTKLVFGAMTKKMAGAVKYSDANEVNYANDAVQGEGAGVLKMRPRGGSDIESLKEQAIFKGSRGVEKFGEGSDAIGKIGGLPGLVEAMNLAKEMGSPDKMQEAVSKAAADLKAPTDIFANSTTKFDGSVDKFIAYVSGLGVSTPTGTKGETNRERVVYHKGTAYSAAKKK